MDISSARISSASGSGSVGVRVGGDAAICVAPAAAEEVATASVTFRIARIAASPAELKAPMCASTSAVAASRDKRNVASKSDSIASTAACVSSAGGGNSRDAGVAVAVGVAAAAAASSSALPASAGCENSQSIAISIDRPRTAISAALA